mgnify:CR=1 FL=1
MTKLTTHVLDVYSGKPGKGIHVELFFINNTERKKINSIKLNDDGRANSPLVEGENFVKGKYELVFYIAHGIDHLNGNNDDTLEKRRKMHNREKKWIAKLDKIDLLNNLIT